MTAARAASIVPVGTVPKVISQARNTDERSRDKEELCAPGWWKSLVLYSYSAKLSLRSPDYVALHCNNHLISSILPSTSTATF
jgi:hypothetical protein